MKLALYKAAEGTLLDKVIDLGSGLYGYSHCELVFDRIVPDVGGKSYCYSSSPREGECRFKYIDLDSGKWEVIDLSDQFEWEDESIMFQDAKFFQGAEYDYYGIICWYVFAFIKKQKSSQWWCSEICARLLGWSDFRVTPNKLARHYKAPRGKFSFKLIWKKIY